MAAADSVRKIEGLKIDRVSGVDWPANLEPGWLVMKGASREAQLLAVAERLGESVEQTAVVLKAAEALGADLGELDLAEALGLYADELPEGEDFVEKAGRKISRARLTRLKNAQGLINELIGEVDDSAPPVDKAKTGTGSGGGKHHADGWDGTPHKFQQGDDGKNCKLCNKSDGGDAHTVAKAAGDQDVKDKLTPTEGGLVPDPDPTGGAPSGDTPLEELMKSVPEPVRKAMETMQKAADDAVAKAAQAEVVAKAEREARLTNEYVAKAQTFRHLPAGTPAEGETVPTLDRVLRAVDESLPAPEAAEVNRLLKAADAAFAKSMGAGSGSEGNGPNSAGSDEVAAWAAIESAAAELRMSNPDWTKETAIAKATEIRPELAANYRAAVRQGSEG